MGELKKVSVKIRGIEYRVNCTEEEEYIEKLAYYIDKKMEQLMAANQSLDTLKATTLVTFNLADSLFKAVKTINKLSGKNGINLEDSIYKEIDKLDKEGIPKE